jgi:DNA repair photolyase
MAHMHDHAAWLKDGMTGADEQAVKTYQFFMRVDPDMRDFLGPIERVQDERTGREMRTRKARVATLRGQKEENMQDVVVYLDPLPHIRVKNAKDLQGWYQAKQEQRSGSRVRPCFTDAILTEPYGGYCTVGCTFCYINSGHRGYRGSGLITVPLDYGAHVRKQLSGMAVSTAGYFSSFTDPFLPLEDLYHNTQAAATEFDRAGLPVFFLSRLEYPGWAFDLMQKNRYSYMQKSINTPDQADWERLSPGAAPLATHMEQIREARRRGIYVSIQVNPIIAGIVTHDDVEELFDMLAEAGANHVIVKFVEANFPWAPAMVERITKRFGDNRAAKFRELFTQNCSGQQKTITEEYRREGHERYRRKATSLGMTYALCYEYTKNPDGAWVNMGKEFMTSDQCHGHRVPMHVRTGDRFAALSACPPSGCLTCAPEGEDRGACGSELLGQAKALRLSDLRKPFDGRVEVE